jgi:hypothetical protein
LFDVEIVANVVVLLFVFFEFVLQSSALVVQIGYVTFYLSHSSVGLRVVGFIVSFGEFEAQQLRLNIFGAGCEIDVLLDESIALFFEVDGLLFEFIEFCASFGEVSLHFKEVGFLFVEFCAFIFEFAFMDFSFPFEFVNGFQ